MIFYPPSILIIADQPGQVVELKQKLESKGYSVDQTDLSSHNLAIMGQKYFDLIVLDIVSPRLDSCKICHMLKSNVELAAVPIIVLTTHNCIATTMSKLSSIYFVLKDAADPILFQIIDEKHYLSQRYS